MSKAAVAETHDQESALAQAVSGPARLMQFFHDTRQEMRKVATPSGTEVKNLTIVVLATTFFFAAYFFLVDSVLGTAIDTMFKHLMK